MITCILFTIFKRSNFKFNYYYLKLPRDSTIIFNKLFNNSFNNVFITRELLRLYFWQCSWRGWRGPSLSTSQLQLSCVCVCLAYKHRRPAPPGGAWTCQLEPALNTLSLSSQKHGLCLSTQHTPPVLSSPSSVNNRQQHPATQIYLLERCLDYKAELCSQHWLIYDRLFIMIFLRHFRSLVMTPGDDQESREEERECSLSVYCVLCCRPPERLF